MTIIVLKLHISCAHETESSKNFPYQTKFKDGTVGIFLTKQNSNFEQLEFSLPNEIQT